MAKASIEVKVADLPEVKETLRYAAETIGRLRLALERAADFACLTDDEPCACCLYVSEIANDALAEDDGR